MPIYRAQVVLNKRSGIPRDAVTNSWTFFTTSANGDVLAGDLVGRLETFYTAIGGYLANSLTTTANANRLKVYRLTPGQAGPDDDVLGPPVGERSWTLGAAGAGGTASELAIALSFNADVAGVSEEVGVTRPANRRRGRVFLGPLNENTGGYEAQTNEFRPNDGVRNAILDAVMTLRGALAAINPVIEHVIYSAMDNTHRPVVRYTVDNAYDVQRRRGVRPTNKLQRLVLA